MEESSSKQMKLLFSPKNKQQLGVAVARSLTDFPKPKRLCCCCRARTMETAVDSLYDICAKQIAKQIYVRNEDLLDNPESKLWQHVERIVRRQLVSRGLPSMLIDDLAETFLTLTTKAVCHIRLELADVDERYNLIRHFRRDDDFDEYICAANPSVRMAAEVLFVRDYSANTVCFAPHPANDLIFVGPFPSLIVFHPITVTGQTVVEIAFNADAINHGLDLDPPLESSSFLPS